MGWGNSISWKQQRGVAEEYLQRMHTQCVRTDRDKQEVTQPFTPRDTQAYAPSIPTVTMLVPQ